MSNRIPSAIDLMLYADGELDPERVKEVEAYLAGSREGRAILATFDEIGFVVRSSAEQAALQSGADGIADLVMAKIEQESSSNVVALRPRKVLPRASEVDADGRKSIAIAGYGVGLLAAAAAFFLVAWHFLNPSVSSSPLAATLTIPQSDQAIAPIKPAPEPDSEPEPGVFVNAIDFGALAGTVFYVPNDDNGAMTTVVWLTDDETGGKP